MNTERQTCREAEGKEQRPSEQESEMECQSPEQSFCLKYELRARLRDQEGKPNKNRNLEVLTTKSE